jgi:alginate O-acetyltransferase complex protein AlgI
MLFNSYEFLLGFLPLSLLVFHLLRRVGLDRIALAGLTLLSLGFYGWWNPVYLLLLVPLILVNFAVASWLSPRSGLGRRAGRALLVLGVAIDLGTLAWFKYANFVANEASAWLELELRLARIVLPLGISFFIFQMIASLVDAYRGKLEKLDLLHYTLFVTFFPQLIAGPIIHPREILPQFEKGSGARAEIPLGLTILVIGLVKKVLLADSVAPYASSRFDASALGQALAPSDAWAGVMAYTAQLYFDFSGYSDMAIGAALLFGIRLPVNFASPYKAESIIEFWRRWHITLSRFLREYLYIPLGGNRHGPARRHVNLFITMVLGGIWHGAGWTFLVWGALHGFYLALNHGWRALAARLRIDVGAHWIGRASAWLVTFVAVMVGWVFFRAADVGTALRMLTALFGVAGGAPAAFGDTHRALVLATALLILARFAPSTQESTGYRGPFDAEPGSAPRIRWRASPAWAVAVGAALAIALMSLSQVSEFLYFQF